MPKKDTIAKRLLSNSERAADLFNQTYGRGERLVTGKQLRLVESAQYHVYEKEDGTLEEDNRFQDLLYEVSFPEIDSMTKVYFGLEVQSTQDKNMPIRIQEYFSRLCVKHQRELYPIVIVVDNFSHSKWRYPKHLRKLYVGSATSVSSFYVDFSIRVIDPWRIGLKSMRRCCTDMGFILHCFRNSNNKNKLFRQAKRYFSNVILDQDARLFLKIYLNMHLPDAKNNEEDDIMCKAMEELEQDLINKGVKQGIRQGIVQGVRQGIVRGVKQGEKRGIKQGKTIGLMQGRAKFMKRYIESSLKSRISVQEIVQQLKNIFQATNAEIAALMPSQP